MNKSAQLFAAIAREPFRLFFPLGIVAGTIGIGHWVLYAVGLIDGYSGFFHSSIQTMVYLNCFIIGFLMTAFPRFTQTITARWWEVLIPLLLFVGIVVFLLLDKWVFAECVLLGWYAFVMYFTLSRVLGRTSSSAKGTPPVELIFVPIALLQGIFGALFLILGQTKVLSVWALKVGKPMMDQGFLVCLVMGIGGFLIPRLMGTYDKGDSVHQVQEVKCNTHYQQENLIKGKIFYYLLCATLFVVSFFVEGFGSASIGYGLRAAAVTAVFMKSNVLSKFPKDVGLYVWMAWGSVWMVALGFWGASLLSKYQLVMLHVTFIGGFSLMTFAIASMVIMSHAGEASRLNTGLWILSVVIIGICSTVLLRLAVVFFPDGYFQILGWAAGIWIVAAWVWLIDMLPRILKVPHSDEFGRMHEKKSYGHKESACIPVMLCI